MQNQDEVTVVQNMVITAETGRLITTSVKSEYRSAKSRATAYDAAYADGVRAEMIVKDDPVREQVKSFMLDGMPTRRRNGMLRRFSNLMRRRIWVVWSLSLKRQWSAEPL
jgi:hypothetical protein